MKLTKHAWMMLLPLAAMTLAYLNFFFFPYNEKIEAARQELAARRNAVSRGGELADATLAAQARLHEVTEYIEQCEARLIPSGGVHELFGAINDQMTRTDVTPTHMEPARPVKLETLEQIPVTLSCKGDFQKIWSFLVTLDQQKQLFWFDRLSLQPARGDGQGLECSLDLVVFTSRAEISDQDDPAGDR